MNFGARFHVDDEFDPEDGSVEQLPGRIGQMSAWEFAHRKFDTVPRDVLLECQKRVRAASFEGFSGWFLEERWAQMVPGNDLLVERNPSLLIRQCDLLGVPDACIQVMTPFLPWRIPGIWRWRNEPESSPEEPWTPDVPHFITFGAASPRAVRHEKIRLCQQLLAPCRWPAPLLPLLRHTCDVARGVGSLPERVRVLCAAAWLAGEFMSEIEAAWFETDEPSHEPLDALRAAAESIDDACHVSLPFEFFLQNEVRLQACALDIVRVLFGKAEEATPWLAAFCSKLGGEHPVDNIMRDLELKLVCRERENEKARKVFDEPPSCS
jgi:hypothetical protein